MTFVPIQVNFDIFPNSELFGGANDSNGLSEISLILNLENDGIFGIWLECVLYFKNLLPDGLTILINYIELIRFINASENVFVKIAKNT